MVCACPRFHLRVETTGAPLGSDILAGAFHDRPSPPSSVRRCGRGSRRRPRPGVCAERPGRRRRPVQGRPGRLHGPGVRKDPGPQSRNRDRLRPGRRRARGRQVAVDRSDCRERGEVPRLHQSPADRARRFGSVVHGRPGRHLLRHHRRQSGRGDRHLRHPLRPGRLAQPLPRQPAGRGLSVDAGLPGQPACDPDGRGRRRLCGPHVRLRRRPDRRDRTSARGLRPGGDPAGLHPGQGHRPAGRDSEHRRRRLAHGRLGGGQDAGQGPVGRLGRPGRGPADPKGLSRPVGPERPAEGRPAARRARGLGPPPAAGPAILRQQPALHHHHPADGGRDPPHRPRPDGRADRPRRHPAEGPGADPGRRGGTDPTPARPS